MKLNTPVTGVEHVLAEGEIIVSTTDLKGRITSVNEAFVRISGFTREELIGQSHNLVRHPDMPPEAFADLWAALRAGRTWSGIVKNRCKNGDHYWVDAFVAPVRENDRIVGYQSVRRRPAAKRVARATALYARLRGGRKPALGRARVGLAGRVAAGQAVLLAPAFALLTVLGQLTAPVAAAAWALTALAGWALARRLLTPLRRLADATRRTVDNPLIARIYTGRSDELGQIGAALSQLDARIATVLGRLGEFTGRLDEVVYVQGRNIEQVSGALHQMGASVQEVATSAHRTAEVSREADQAAERGVAEGARVRGVIDELEQEVVATGGALQSLVNEVGRIEAVLSLIEEVAFQTHLLSLNAAVEAARSGEHGRGFAVVAGEVKDLAQRSRGSVADIRTTVARLREQAAAASAAMANTRRRTSEGREEVGRMAEGFGAIAGRIGQISQLNAAVASAAEQQSQTMEELGRNMTEIHELANSEHADGGDEVASLTELTARLQVLVRQVAL